MNVTASPFWLVVKRLSLVSLSGLWSSDHQQVTVYNWEMSLYPLCWVIRQSKSHVWAPDSVALASGDVCTQCQMFLSLQFDKQNIYWRSKKSINDWMHWSVYSCRRDTSTRIRICLSLKGCDVIIGYWYWLKNQPNLFTLNTFIVKRQLRSTEGQKEVSLKWCNIILVCMAPSVNLNVVNCQTVYSIVCAHERVHKALWTHDDTHECLQNLFFIRRHHWPLLADGFECSSVLLHVRWTGSSRVSCQIAAMLQMNTTASLSARTLAGQFGIKAEIQYLFM